MNNENSKAKKIAILALVFAILAIGSVESGIGNTLSNMQCIELISLNGTYWHMFAEDAGIVFDTGRCVGVNGTVVYPQFNETQLNHNNLSGLQGGSTNERYHMTALQNATFGYNASYALNTTMNTQDNLKVNKSGDTITGNILMESNDPLFQMHGNDISGEAYYEIANNNSNIIMIAKGATYGGTTFAGLTGNNQVILEAQRSSSSFVISTTSAGTIPIVFAPGRIKTVTINSTGTTFHKDVNMGGFNITNCLNCSTTAMNDLKVNKTGDTMTGSLLFSNGGRLWNPGTYIDLRGNGNNVDLLLAAGLIGGTSSVQIGTASVLFPVQAPTASAPTYVKGGMYFDTTLNKLRVGGATGWETVTSI